MDAIVGSELLYGEEIARWTRVGELGTEAGLREAGCSEETIAETLSYLGAAENLDASSTLYRRLSADARAVVCATVGRGISSGVKRFIMTGDSKGSRLAEFTALCVNLRSNINIKYVDLSGDPLVRIPQGFTLLATALKSNSAIEKLELLSCSIGTAGARCLMEGLKSSKTITSLDLQRNLFQDEAIEAVADFLATNVSLKRLFLGCNGKEWGDESSTSGAVLFRSALERNVTLEHLDLEVHGLDDNYMKILLEPFCGEVGDEASPSKAPMNTAVKWLSLSSIDHLHPQLIESIIKTNKSLSSLRLIRATLSPKDWKEKILAALKENETLEELHILFCRGMSEDVYEDLMNLLRYSGTRLRRINLYGSQIKSRQGQVDEELRVNAQYRSQLRGQTQVQTRSGRLVLCGYEFAGKTAIRESMKCIEQGTPWSYPFSMGLKKVMEVASGLLCGRDAYEERNRRTRGVDILVLQKQEHLASVWDFAGQKEYYALHDYLFPNVINSCFLYVCSCRCPPDSQNPQGKVKDLTSMEKECEYWMRFIASNSTPRQGGLHPQFPQVRFVLTHKDTLDFNSLNISRQYAEDVVHELRRKFQDVLAICETVQVVNAHSLVDVQSLMTLTNDTLKDILKHQTEYAVCKAVRNAMESLSAKNPSKPVLSMTEFDNICRKDVWPLAPMPCREAHLNTIVGQKVVLNYLNDIGDLIFPKGLNFIVTNPRWFGVGVLGSLINPFDQPRVSMFSGKLGRPKDLWKVHHKAGFVKKQNIESLLHHSLQTMNLQQTITSSMLIEVMIQLELCFEKEPGNEDSSLFIPVLFDDETESAAKGRRQLQWKLERPEPLYYFGRRLECKNKSITFLTPGFFPRLQVYLQNYIHEKNWTQNTGFEVGRNLICFAENGMEVIVEYSGDIDYFVDILVRSSKPYAVALQFVEEHVVKKVVQFCASPQGCQGVLLVEAVIRPVCVRDLYLCAERLAHSILSSILTAYVVEDDGYEHTWSSKIKGVSDTDLAYDLLEGEGSYMSVLEARQLNLLGETSGCRVSGSNNNDEWLRSEAGQVPKLLSPRVEDVELLNVMNPVSRLSNRAPRSSLENIASSSATNAIPHLKRINDSICIFHDTPNPKMTVIFFHDVNWRQYQQPHIQSWMSCGTPSVCWPKQWLSVKYPNARILSAAYDAGPWKTDTDGRMRLYQIAENLRHDILPIYTKDNPLVLVGHGLGGLVIKELVRSLQQERDALDRGLHAHDNSAADNNLPKLNSLLRNVRGVFFFAPAWLGSRLVDYTKSNVRGSSLKYMEVMNTDSAELNEWFRKWRESSRCRTTTIYSGLPTTVELPPQVAVTYRQFNDYIVEEGSARLDSDTFYTSPGDHFSVCKPHDESDSSFSRLIELIGTIL